MSSIRIYLMAKSETGKDNKKKDIKNWLSNTWIPGAPGGPCKPGGPRRP